MTLFKCLRLHTLQKYRLSTVTCKSTESNLLKSSTFINRIPQRQLFWEKDRKGGYNSNEKISKIKLIKDGFRELKSEFKMLGQEIKEFIAADPLLIARPGKFKLQYFNSNSTVPVFIINFDYTLHSFRKYF